MENLTVEIKDILEDYYICTPTPEETQNYNLLIELKTDEETFEFLSKNEEKISAHLGRLYLKHTCSMKFFQSSKLILSISTNYHKNYKELKSNPCAIFSLFCCIKFNFFEFFEYLLENGVNPFIRQQRGETIIDYAVYLNNEEAFNYLLFKQKYFKEKNFFQTTNKNYEQIIKAFFTAISINNRKFIDYFLNQFKMELIIKNKKGENALHICAIYNQIEIAKDFIERGIKIDQVTNIQNSPLQLAIKYKNFDFAKYLIDQLILQGKNVEFAFCEFSKPFVKVTEKFLNKKIGEEEKEKYFEFSKYFIEKTNNYLPKVIDKNGNNLLHLSASNDMFELSKYLIEEKKLSANSLNNKKYTPLHLAIQSKAETKLLIFLEKNTTSNSYFQKNLIELSIKKKAENFIIYLIEKITEKEKISFNFDDFLYKSISQNLFNLSKFLIPYTKDINSIGNNKYSALMISVKENFIEFSRYLVDNISNVDINYFIPLHNETLLHLLAKNISNEYFEFTKYLYEKKGFNIDKISFRKMPNPLIFSVLVDNFELIKYFIEVRKIPYNSLEQNTEHFHIPNNYHNDIYNNYYNNSKENTLHLAGRYGSDKMIKYLINDAKMKIYQLSKSGESILSISVKRGNFKMANYLIEEIKMNLNIHNNLDNDNNLVILTILLLKEEGALEFLKYLIEEKKMDYKFVSKYKHKEQNLLITLIRTNQSFSYYKKEFNLELIDYLLKLGIKINDLNSDKKNALHECLGTYSFNIAKHLIKRGININQNCPLNGAFINNNQNLVIYLMKKDCQLADYLPSIDNYGRNTLKKNVMEIVGEDKVLKSYAIIKGLDHTFTPHSRVILSFDKRNLENWKKIFVSSINYTPFIFSKDYQQYKQTKNVD